MISLYKDIETFDFFEREKNRSGKVVSNKCGRDFIYFVLNYYYKEKFNKGPLEIERKKTLGIAVYSWLAWTQIQFFNIGSFFRENSLKLTINNFEIKNYFSFVRTTLFSRIKFDEAIKNVEDCIKKNIACGIDISVGFWGLFDHVLFVYGFDDNNFYVFDTHKVSQLEYEQMSCKFLYKLPKRIIKKRWSRFGRVWKIKKVHS